MITVNGVKIICSLASLALEVCVELFFFLSDSDIILNASID